MSLKWVVTRVEPKSNGVGPKGPRDMPAAASNREFSSGKDITAKGHRPGWSSSPDRDESVVVTLSDGSIHTHHTGSFSAVDYEGVKKERWERASSYEVLPTGDLAVICRDTWLEGREPVEEDTERVVRVYSARSWGQVAGVKAADQYRDRLEQEKHQRHDARRAGEEQAQLDAPQVD